MSAAKIFRHHFVHQPDYALAIVVFALALFGIAMISSASVVTANAITGKNSYYFWHQFSSFAVGATAFFFASKINYRLWKKFAPLFLLFAFGLMFLVFIPGIRSEYGTSQSWIHLPFFPSIQPVEVAKLAMIVYLASWMESKEKNIPDFHSGFIPFSVILGSLLVLLMLQPDFGSILVLTAIGGAMFFVGGARGTHLALGVSAGAVVAALVMSFKTYIRNRMLAFLYSGIDPEGIGYHIKQSLIAVGSGGFFGLGYGSSRQKFEYLPEAQGDSIFAIAAEELGFVRVIFIVLGFALIVRHGLIIALQTEDRFGKLLAVGISAWIAIQAFINIAVNLSLAPVTGLTLPFISYGGSSLVMSMLAMGILVNISRYTDPALYRVNQGSWWRRALRKFSAVKA